MAAVAGRTEHKQDQGAAPQRLLGTGPRRWRWLAIGAALMAMGATAVAAALGQVDERSGVVAATRDLPGGHVVAEGDLQVVEIAGGERLAAIPSARIDGMIGQTVLSPISKNALIAPAELGGDTDYPAEDEAVVGASLADNQVPISLQAGAQVALVITAPPSGESGEATSQEDPAATAATSPPPEEAIAGRVQSVDRPDDASGGQTTRVELVVDAADAAAVARAASADALTAVEVAEGQN
ncbi:hypothetical protein LP52_18025 [Streptomonospora alba]|uniref:SAF domain-containing protein n=1 Tax=Streptomonospora alba TaxID=183763 RepID=A0A0C2G2T4_9ACTN|nr:SAF domain-containing protein [Streptomonospora alba]KIH97613.1 hypothetical protein LP52_18025 [Streptomonospora alba]